MVGPRGSPWLDAKLSLSRCSWRKLFTPSHLLPQGSLDFITKSQCAFLWASSDKVSGGKCKVNWNTVCRSTVVGGLGILDINKFSRALRLRRPWLAWTEPENLGLGSGVALAPHWIWMSSTARLVLRLTMGRRQVFGTRLGYRGPRRNL